GIRDLTVTGVQTCALPISREKDNPRAEAGRQAALQKIREKPAPPPPKPPAAEDPWTGAVDALSAVDLPRNVVSGKWTREGDALRSEERRVGKEGRSRWRAE